MKIRKSNLKEKRKRRVTAKMKGVSSRLRLSVFRSNKYIYAQIIDDQKGKTLVSSSEKELDKIPQKKETKIERARQVGQLLARKALTQKIKNVAFNRGGYKYHGRVKALAEGVREGGLVF